MSEGAAQETVAVVGPETVAAGVPGAPGRRSGTGTAEVVAVAEALDQGPVPTVLTAATLNWYPVLAVRPVTDAVRPETTAVADDQEPDAPMRCWTV